MATATQMAGSPAHEREAFSGERSFDQPSQAEQSQGLPATPITTDRPSTSANPHDETPERPLTEEEKLEKAIRLEDRYGLMHGSETQGVGLDARLKRAEKFMADQRVYTLLRRERWQTIKGKAREPRIGQPLWQGLPEAAWSDTSSSLETTSTSRARIDRLERGMSRIDQLEQGMSRVLELLERMHGGAQAGTGSRSTTSTDRTVLATPSAVTAASSPDTVPTAAAPRPSVTFAPSTPPIQTARPSIRHPIEAISMFGPPQQTSTPRGGLVPSVGAPASEAEYDRRLEAQGEYRPAGGIGGGGGGQPSGPGGGGPDSPGGFGPGGGGFGSPGGGPPGPPPGRPSTAPGGPPGSPGPTGAGYPLQDRRPPRDDKPRIPRQSELGDFNPRDKRPLAFWAHMEHFRSNGLYEDRAILGVLHSCMRGEAKDWFDSLFPRPTTWQEWRTAFFQKWTEDPSSASLKMLGRTFKPKREALSTYLYDKYWLIGMESVARLLIYSSPNVDIAERDVMPLLNQRSVSELVGLVHNGLPSVWQTRLYEPMETATSWNDYLLKMTKRESYIRAELNVWVRSTQNDDDSDTDTGTGRTTWRRGEGGRFRKRGAATKRASKTKARASAVASGSRSNPAPLTKEEHEKTKAYVRRVEKAYPRINRLFSSVLKDESSSGSSSDGNEEDSFTDDATSDDSTSEHDVRRVRSVKVIRRTSTRPSGREPGTLHRNTTTFKLCVRVEGQDRYELLLDSGSEISLISTRALKSVAPDVERLPAQQIELHGFDDGDRQMTKSVVVLPVTFAGRDGEEKTEWCEFHEVDRCADGWLLGVDNMVEVGVVCDPTTWTATFRRAPAMTAELIRSKDKDRAKQTSSTTLTAETADGTSPIDLSGLSQEESTTFRELEIEYPHGSEAIQVAVSSSLDDSQQEALLAVLQSQQVWPTKERPLGLYEQELFDIELKDGQDGWKHSEPPRRTSPAQKTAIEEALREHDELNLSEPGTSPHSSGVVLVPQRDKLRFCVDYRPLNNVTKDVSYFSPKTDEIYGLLTSAVFLTIVDCNKGYHQFACTERTRQLTAFITMFGTRLWNRMPFGPKSAPAFFQRVIDNILAAFRFICAIAYLDDILVFSPTYEQHLVDVRSVLTALGDAGITIAPKKCAFAFTSLKLLGYRAHALGIMVDEERTRAVREFPVPTTAKEALRFYAMASWYRKFVENFATRAKPINEAIHSEPFRWTGKQQQAFDDLKRALTTTPILRRPDYARPFILDVDASAVGFGAALIQLQEDGKEHPIVYVSRQTKSPETRYGATNLELQCVVWAVSKLAHYIDGSHLTVRSDHQALKYLWDLKSEAPTGRLQRLALALAPLRDKIKVEYRKGSFNNVADALSRSPLPEQSPEQQINGGTGTSGGDQLTGNSGGTAGTVVDSGSLVGEQRRDKKHKTDIVEDKGPKVGDQQSDIQDGKGTGGTDGIGGRWSKGESNVGGSDKDKGRRRSPRLQRQVQVAVAVRQVDEGSHPRFFVEDDLLFERSGPELDQIRICVPEDKIQTIIDEFHKSPRAGHPSVKRTTEAIKNVFTFPDLNSRVLEAVAKCYECQTNKARHHKEYGQLIPIYSPPKVFDTLGIDFVTGLIPAGDQR
ncbi:hypothetical protein CF336_g7658, partial [Tilletia laevis]